MTKLLTRVRREPVYRTNTYAFLHINLLHMLMNVLALTPLLERFESEYGTLTSLALFFGREFLPRCSYLLSSPCPWSLG